MIYSLEDILKELMKKLMQKVYGIHMNINFVISYFLLFFFWIYLGYFCAVYKNTQIHLLIEVTSSFNISLISPLFIILLTSIFRMLSLKNKKPILFKFSNFLLNLV